MDTSSIGHWLRLQPSLLGTPPHFDTSNLPAKPEELFVDWLRRAIDSGVAEPHTFTLATVDADGCPDARTLILKDVGPAGWAVAGTHSSAKGVQLAANPVAALNFWWQPIMRAVRVRGTVVEASPDESAADLAARSESARAGVADGDWALWRIEPQSVEFWQGSSDRRHIRVIYERRMDRWEHCVRGGEGPTK